MSITGGISSKSIANIATQAAKPAPNSKFSGIGDADNVPSLAHKISHTGSMSSSAPTNISLSKIQPTQV